MKQAVVASLIIGAAILVGAWLITNHLGAAPAANDRSSGKAGDVLSLEGRKIAVDCKDKVSRTEAPTGGKCRVTFRKDYVIVEAFAENGSRTGTAVYVSSDVLSANIEQK